MAFQTNKNNPKQIIMQEEIKKHTKKIYKKVNSKEHTVAEKVKDIVIEILIIVFAVSLSIWFHNWSEESHNEKDAIGFLKDLKMDLKNDSTAFENSIQAYQKNIQILNSEDSNSNVFFVSTLINNGNFEGFKQSGKIGFIKNDELRLELLRYYGKTHLGMQTYTNICNDLLMKTISSPKSENDKIHKTYTAQATNNIKHLKQNIATITSIVRLIDETISE